MGPDGLRQVAEVSFKRAHALADRLTALPGWERAFPEREFLNEFPMRVPRSPAVLRKLARNGILGGLDAHRWFRELKGVLTFTCTEVNDPRALDELVAALEA
jgi:glycine dehydrogenase subunit 1